MTWTSWNTLKKRKIINLHEMYVARFELCPNQSYSGKLKWPLRSLLRAIPLSLDHKPQNTQTRWWIWSRKGKSQRIHRSQEISRQWKKHLDYLKGYENGHMKGPPPLIDVYGHGEARLGHTSGWPKGPHLTELSSRDGNCRFKISFLVSLKMQCG